MKEIVLRRKNWAVVLICSLALMFALTIASTGTVYADECYWQRAAENSAAANAAASRGDIKECVAYTIMANDAVSRAAGGSGVLS